MPRQWLTEGVLPTVSIAVLMLAMIIPFTLTLANYASDPAAPENFLHHYDTPYPSSTSSSIQPPSCVDANRVTVVFLLGLVGGCALVGYCCLPRLMEKGAMLFFAAPFSSFLINKARSTSSPGKKKVLSGQKGTRVDERSRDDHGYILKIIGKTEY